MTLEQQIQSQLEQQAGAGQANIVRIEVEPGMRATYVNRGQEQAVQQGSDIGTPESAETEFTFKHRDFNRFGRGT